MVAVVAGGARVEVGPGDGHRCGRPRPARRRIGLGVGVGSAMNSNGDRGTGADPPNSAPMIYLLLFNDPDQPAAGYGLGWSLAAWEGSEPRWSTSLTGRGAGAHTGPRLAQAAAVRVLAEHGVPVAGWHAGDARLPAMFRARVKSPVAAPADANRSGAPADPAVPPGASVRARPAGVVVGAQRPTHPIPSGRVVRVVAD